MRCPSCGASYSNSDCCTECGTAVLSSTELDVKESESTTFEVTTNSEPLQQQTSRKSTLLEFPGVVRSTVPDWRRELSERVREVQERRAREAAQEAAEAESMRLAQAAAAPAPQLELLPQATAPTLNPLVAAALRRIERANQQLPTAATHARTAAAVAYATEEELDSSPDERLANSAGTLDLEQPPVEPSSAPAEKTHNLAVVPAPTTTTTSKPEPKVVARRLISDHDPVLNYLDAVPTTFHWDQIAESKAGFGRRVCGALVDLVVCALLFSPFAAAVELTGADWHRLRTIVLALAISTIVSFIYLTVSTALTGRTLGMRVFSMRTVDRKTGLIPTGAQSTGRAVVYLASLYALGLPAIYALMNREGYTAHDQMTHTIVVHD
jgi:uncharacterized RDD family membrane protein YckC